jgi:hypothetical protein
VKKVILTWQRPLWEGDQEVVKRSGRNEPMWIAIHICVETMLGISLYSYLYLKLAKAMCLSYYHLCFLFNKIGEEDGAGSAQNRGEVAQTMYTHESKYKNGKMKGENKKKVLVCVFQNFTV